MTKIDDGQHRRGYQEYSRTGSGGTIYVSESAPPDKRWWIEHPHFGNRYFADHDDILKWTVEETRRRFKEKYGEPWKR